MARGRGRVERDEPEYDDGEFYILRGSAMRDAIAAMFGGSDEDDYDDEDDEDDRRPRRRRARDERDDRRDPPGRSGSRFFR